jgi:CRISPR/Cas system-associated exonuclease Cas4 (RecB family)
MTLPAGFVFSQASLQDFVECPRRFELRYVLDVRWPSARDNAVTEWERHAQQGATFHRLIHRHTRGIPAETLSHAAKEHDILKWWQAFLHMPPQDLPAQIRRSEVRLSTPIGNHRLAARYDLLAIDPGSRAMIVDWKTNRKRPKRDWLERRMQSVVYPLVLAMAGAHLNGDQSIAPAQIELVYWFANYPAQVERFAYDPTQHTTARQKTQQLIETIDTYEAETWSLTDNVHKCRYCTYRTLCDREAVDATEMDAPTERKVEEELLDLDLEQIAEIEF